MDSDAKYLPSSANLGTICTGGKSAYLELLTVLIISERSSLDNLFFGSGLLTKGR